MDSVVFKQLIVINRYWFKGVSRFFGLLFKYAEGKFNKKKITVRKEENYFLSGPIRFESKW